MSEMFSILLTGQVGVSKCSHSNSPRAFLTVWPTAPPYSEGCVSFLLKLGGCLWLPWPMHCRSSDPMWLRVMTWYEVWSLLFFKILAVGTRPPCCEKTQATWRVHVWEFLLTIPAKVLANNQPQLIDPRVDTLQRAHVGHTWLHLNERHEWEPLTESSWPPDHE